MKNTKRVMNAFSVYDRTGIENYLMCQAREGWMLERMGSFFWYFKKVEPVAGKFSVTYFPKASFFEAEPSEGQQTFLEYCSHTGWELVASSGQLQVFYSSLKEPVPIETDAQMEVENVHSSAKKSFLWLYPMLWLVGLFQAVVVLWRAVENPLEALSSNAFLLWGFCILLWSTISISDACGYFRWYRRARKKAAEENCFLETRGSMKTYILSLAVMLVGDGFLLMWLSKDSAGAFAIIGALGIAAVVITIVIISVVGFAKKIRLSKKANFTITVTVTIILLVLLLVTMFVMFGGLVRRNSADRYSIYMVGDHKHRSYHDDIPLKIEDLTDTDSEYSYTMEKSGDSVIMNLVVANQTPHLNSGEHMQMEYMIISAKLPYIYEWCLNKAFDGEQDTYKSIDAGEWYADEAYQQYDGDEAQMQFILCYGRTVVKLQFNSGWQLTAEQRKIISEKVTGN